MFDERPTETIEAQAALATELARYVLHLEGESLQLVEYLLGELAQISAWNSIREVIDDLRPAGMYFGRKVDEASRRFGLWYDDEYFWEGGRCRECESATINGYYTHERGVRTVGPVAPVGFACPNRGRRPYLDNYGVDDHDEDGWDEEEE